MRQFCKQVTRQVVPYLKVIRYHTTFTMDTKDIFFKKILHLHLHLNSQKRMSDIEIGYEYYVIDKSRKFSM